MVQHKNASKTTESEMSENAPEKKDRLMNIVKLLFGLVLVIGGVVSYLYWWQDLLVLIRGSVGLVLFLFGFIFLLMGWSDLH